jgi:hypothetical protein
MTDYAIFTVAPEITLAELQAVVHQQEQLLGPLASIGNDGTVTLLTFDVSQDPPKSPAILLAGGRAQTLAGNALISAGKAFLGRQLEDIAAYRTAG